MLWCLRDGIRQLVGIYLWFGQASMAMKCALPREEVRARFFCMIAGP
jgi:hypothetical protein